MRYAALSSALLVLAACGPLPPRTDDAPEPERRRVHGAVNGTESVASLDMDDVAETGGGRIEEVILGRIPGLVVTRTGDGGFSLRIRGVNSIHGDNETLSVIDEMVIPPYGLSSALATLSPRDVARVEVLKDAGATAFYGSRGANGVIVITTRTAQ
jgi:TonB-dependent starch-binding outer membrane protein SusC